jgi:dihydroxyacid dehydratase/phosphogluconate dehydratase
MSATIRDIIGMHKKAGKKIIELVEQGITTRKILAEADFVNAAIFHIELNVHKCVLQIVSIAGERCIEEKVERVLVERRKEWKAPDHSDRKGIFKRYTAHATSAMQGTYLE